MIPYCYNEIMTNNQRKYCELMGMDFHEEGTYATNLPTYAWGRRADAKSTTHTYDILKELIKNTTIPETENITTHKGETTMPTHYNEFFTTGRLYMANVFLPKIKKVIFNPPATIVLWDDKSKTVVKAQNGEPYDPEKGLAMCIVKKVYGNEGRYFNNISKWVDAYYEKLAKDVPPAVVDEPTYFCRIFYETHDEAKRVLDKMKEVRNANGVVTQADLCEIMDMPYLFDDNAIGWTSLRGSNIKKNDNGYFLYLPKTNWTKE